MISLAIVAVDTAENEPSEVLCQGPGGLRQSGQDRFLRELLHLPRLRRRRLPQAPLGKEKQSAAISQRTEFFVLSP